MSAGRLPEWAVCSLLLMMVLVPRRPNYKYRLTCYENVYKKHSYIHQVLYLQSGVPWQRS